MSRTYRKFRHDVDSNSCKSWKISGDYKKHWRILGSNVSKDNYHKMNRQEERNKLHSYMTSNDVDEIVFKPYKKMINVIS